VEVIVERCAGLDVHKDTVMACVRRPGTGTRRVQEVREFRTWTSSLRDLRVWLAAEGVTQVAMEATGVYWRPVWAELEALETVEMLLVNAQHVKNLPGRKTDVNDACWLAQLLECGLLRGSFVPPPVIARLRDLSRYRTKLVQDRAREVQRVQKLLETAGIKLDSVVSDVMGKAARRMRCSTVTRPSAWSMCAPISNSRSNSAASSRRQTPKRRASATRNCLPIRPC